MNNARWENWTNLTLGILLFLAPTFFKNNNLTSEVATRAGWNAWIVGAIIAVSAGMALRNLKPWEEWTNLVLGAWVVLSPWIFGYSTEGGPLWYSLILGAVVATLSAISIPIAQKLQYQK